MLVVHSTHSSVYILSDKCSVFTVFVFCLVKPQSNILTAAHLKHHNGPFSTHITVNSFWVEEHAGRFSCVLPALTQNQRADNIIQLNIHLYH